MNYEEFFKTLKQKLEDRGVHYILAIPKDRDQKLENEWEKMISDQKALINKTIKNTEKLKNQTEKLQQAIEKKLKINERKLEVTKNKRKATELLSMLPENPDAIEEKQVEAKRENLKAYESKMTLKEQEIEIELQNAYEEQKKHEIEIGELTKKAEELNQEAKDSLILQMNLEKRGHEFSDKDLERAKNWAEKTRKTLQYKTAILMYETEKSWVFRMEEPLRLKNNPMPE